MTYTAESSNRQSSPYAPRRGRRVLSCDGTTLPQFRAKGNMSRTRKGSTSPRSQETGQYIRTSPPCWTDMPVTVPSSVAADKSVIARRHSSPCPIYRGRAQSTPADRTSCCIADLCQRCRWFLPQIVYCVHRMLAQMNSAVRIKTPTSFYSFSRSKVA